MRRIPAQHTVLVLGPSGTGKSTLANAMVQRSAFQSGNRCLESITHAVTYFWNRDVLVVDTPDFFACKDKVYEILRQGSAGNTLVVFVLKLEAGRLFGSAVDMVNETCQALRRVPFEYVIVFNSYDVTDLGDPPALTRKFTRISATAFLKPPKRIMFVPQIASLNRVNNGVAFIRELADLISPETLSTYPHLEADLIEKFERLSASSRFELDNRPLPDPDLTDAEAEVSIVVCREIQEADPAELDELLKLTCGDNSDPAALRGLLLSSPLLQANVNREFSGQGSLLTMCLSDLLKTWISALEVVLDFGAMCNWPLLDGPNAGYYPLHLAVQLGCPDAILPLLEHGANIEQPCDAANGETPLALAYGHSILNGDCVIRLLQEGAHVSDDEPIPAVFDPYKTSAVVRKIGEGAYTRVTQIWWREREVVQKEFTFAPTTTFGQDDFRRYFHRDLRFKSVRWHPNLVRLYSHDMSKKSENWHIVEFCFGSLERILTRSPPVFPRHKLKWCVEICAGLDFLHGIGISHGDLNPRCIMIRKDGSAAIDDFGSSVTVLRTVPTTKWRPKPQYRSPEFFQEMLHLVDRKRADMYALGGVLTYMFTGGLHPFGIRYNRTFYQIFSDKGDAFDFSRDLLPEGELEIVKKNLAEETTSPVFADRLFALIRACFSTDPARRPTARDFLDLLADDQYKLRLDNLSYQLRSSGPALDLP